MRWTKNSEVADYAETEDDRLALAQAVAHEGKPQAAVAYALAQRFAFLFPKYKTLGDFVRAYAQPINPRWFPAGDLHERRLRQLEGNEHAQEEERERAERRLGYAQQRWGDIDPKWRQITLEALDGVLDNPVPGAVHFRAPVGVKPDDTMQQAKAKAKRWAAARNYIPINVGNWKQGTNWFFAVPGSRSVRIINDGDDLPDPKGDGDGMLPSPPAGAPLGPGWGWRWCFYGPSPADVSGDDDA